MAPMIMSTSTRVIEIPLAHRDTPPTSNGLSIFAMFRSKQALAHHQSHCCTCARAFSHIHAPAHAGIGTLSRLGVEHVHVRVQCYFPRLVTPYRGRENSSKADFALGTLQ